MRNIIQFGLYTTWRGNVRCYWLMLTADGELIDSVPTTHAYDSSLPRLGFALRCPEKGCSGYVTAISTPVDAYSMVVESQRMKNGEALFSKLLEKCHVRGEEFSTICCERCATEKRRDEGIEAFKARARKLQEAHEKKAFEKKVNELVAVAVKKRIQRFKNPPTIGDGDMISITNHAIQLVKAAYDTSKTR